MIQIEKKEFLKRVFNRKIRRTHENLELVKLFKKEGLAEYVSDGYCEYWQLTKKGKNLVKILLAWVTRQDGGQRK